jgi:hypothetical protein
VICHPEKRSFRAFTTSRPHFSQNASFGAIGASIGASALLIRDNFKGNQLLRIGSYFSIHVRKRGFFALAIKVSPPRKDDRILYSPTMAIV